MKFFLVRHAQTTANMGKIVLGGKEGGTLSERGKKQALALSKRLEKEKIEQIYCSCSNRAVETAKVISRNHYCETIYCEELREIDTGKLTGLSHEEVEEKYGGVFDEMFEYPSRKLPGGESLKDVQKRVAPLLEELSRKSGNPTILLVGHNVINRVILATLIGMPLENARNIKQKNACLNLLDVKKGFAAIYTIDNSIHSVK